MKAIVNSMVLICASLVFGNATAQENSTHSRYQQAYQGAPVNIAEEHDGLVKKDSRERVVQEHRDKARAKQNNVRNENKRNARKNRYCRDVRQKDGKVIRKCYPRKNRVYNPE